MKSVQTRRLGLWLAMLAVVSLTGAVVAGCAPNANAELISPQLGSQLFAKEANQAIEIPPTPEPILFTSLSPEEVTAGLPEDFAAALAAADPARGETVALANGCIGCHSLDPNQQMTGPTWHNVADMASSRRPNVGPALYIYTSITSPGEYVVPGYPPNIMPPNYADTISQEDLASLVAYLLAQHE